MNKIDKPCRLPYDGGDIDTLWDNHESSIEWFEKHLGLVPTVRANQENFRFESTTQVEMMTFYPERFNLHSVITSKRLVHLFAERGTVDSNIRWCFQTKNLDKEHAYSKQNKIRVSEIYKGPGGKRFFDFWATAEGTRLTAVDAPELPSDSPRYTSALSDRCLRSSKFGTLVPKIPRVYLCGGSGRSRMG
jgi:hypothetical protein